MPSSRTTAGFICLGLLALPLLLTPFRGDSVRAFVLEVEQRDPASFPRFKTLGDVLSAKRWAQTGLALADRFPLRDVVIPLKRGVEYHWLGKRDFGVVERAQDGWLYLTDSYDMCESDPAQAERAVQATLQELDRYVVTHRGRRARLIVCLAPDKVSLYPEPLYAGPRRRYDAFLPARRRLEEHFAASPAPELLDLWTLYRAERDRAAEPIYERLGSHHTRAVGLLMAREIVNGAQPGIWDEGAVVRGESGPAVADLARTAGLSDLREETAQAHVERAGVTVRELWFDRELTTTDPALLLAKKETWSRPLHVVSASSGPPLIPGKALVLHDSFVGTFLRPALWQYFEEVSFLHHHFVSNCELELAFDEYDVIVIEVVERHALQSLLELFAPCRKDPATVTSLRAKVR